jgi:hypothetical protein
MRQLQLWIALDVVRVETISERMTTVFKRLNLFIQRLRKRGEDKLMTHLRRRFSQIADRTIEPTHVQRLLKSLRRRRADLQTDARRQRCPTPFCDDRLAHVR